MRRSSSWRGKTLMVMLPVALVAGAVAQSGGGSWMDDSWSVLLLALVLLVVGVASRRLLLTLVVATVTVLAASAALAPSLATTHNGDSDVTAQPQGLADDGALRAFQDLAVSEVDLSASEPVREATVGALTATSPMEVGSITKALTGLVVADAVSRGELSLHLPVSTYLPELAGSSAGTVTMREFITHHGGYPQFGASSMRRAILNGPFGGPFLTTDRPGMLTEAREASLSDRGSYADSSLGAAVAGQAAAAAAGLPYPELMRTRLFAPLKMTDTSIPTGTPEVTPGRSASGLPTQTWHVEGYAPAAAAVSTTHDVTLLATALLDGTAPGLSALDPLDAGDSSNTQVGGFWQVSHWGNGQNITWHNAANGTWDAEVEQRWGADQDRLAALSAGVTSPSSPTPVTTSTGTRPRPRPQPSPRCLHRLRQTVHEGVAGGMTFTQLPRRWDVALRRAQRRTFGSCPVGALRDNADTGRRISAGALLGWQRVVVWPARHAVIAVLTASPPSADRNLDIHAGS